MGSEGHDKWPVLSVLLLLALVLAKDELGWEWLKYPIILAWMWFGYCFGAWVASVMTRIER
jgi:hypothetical protein